jgi:hypothetical protein
MHMHHLSPRLVRAFNPIRLATGLLVASALSIVACSDSSSPVDPGAFVSPAAVSPSVAISSLGSSSFAVLANAAVTCTDGTITGDVGTYLATPPGAFTQTNCPTVGTTHLGDPQAQAAYHAFLARYVALTPALGECTVLNILTGSLANEVLPAGTYCVSAEAKAGLLTLTGSGPWTFKVQGALTGTGFSVLVPDGDACDVTWWVDAAATMTDSDFKGNILAGAAVSLTRGTFDGNVAAGAAGVGDVTITGTPVTGCAQGSSTNDPPHADAGPDQNVQCVDGDADVKLDGSGSSDPDGDRLTYLWSEDGSPIARGPKPTVSLSLGTHTITLTVDDGNGATDTDDVVITAADGCEECVGEDTTPPEVTAALVPVTSKSKKAKSHKKSNQGLFTVEFTCADGCDPNASPTAMLNGVEVENGQVVDLTLKSKKAGKSAKPAKAGKSKKPMKFESSAFELVAECVDASGNVGSATAVPDFETKSKKSKEGK